MRIKNGFTLIELLITIGLLGIIAIVVALSIKKVQENVKANEWEKVVNRIKSAADTYASENKEILQSIYNKEGFKVITLDDLIEAGLLDENNLIDPNDNQKLTEKSSGYQEIMVYLNENEALSVEYPVNIESYLEINPLKETVLEGQAINYMTGVKAFDSENNEITSFTIDDVTSSGTLNKTNKTVTFTGSGTKAVTIIYKGIKYNRFYEVIPIEQSISTTGEHTIEIKKSGYYQIAASGAQGSSGTNGGTATGKVFLNKGDIINIVVGSQTGGGAGKNSGGEATIIKLVKNNSLVTILTGAGGGGGAGGVAGGSGNALGGANQGAGAGTAGTNGSGGGSSYDYQYECNCSTCGGGCASYNSCATSACGCSQYVCSSSICGQNCSCPSGYTLSGTTCRKTTTTTVSSCTSCTGTCNCTQ